MITEYIWLGEPWGCLTSVNVRLEWRSHSTPYRLSYKSKWVALMVRPGFELGTSCTKGSECTTTPLSQLIMKVAFQSIISLHYFQVLGFYFVLSISLKRIVITSLKKLILTHKNYIIEIIHFQVHISWCPKSSTSICNKTFILTSTWPSIRTMQKTWETRF